MCVRAHNDAYNERPQPHPSPSKGKNQTCTHTKEAEGERVRMIGRRGEEQDIRNVEELER